MCSNSFLQLNIDKDLPRGFSNVLGVGDFGPAMPDKMQIDWRKLRGKC